MLMHIQHFLSADDITSSAPRQGLTLAVSESPARASIALPGRLPAMRIPAASGWTLLREGDWHCPGGTASLISRRPRARASGSRVIMLRGIIAGVILNLTILWTRIVLKNSTLKVSLMQRKEGCMTQKEEQAKAHYSSECTLRHLGIYRRD